MVISSDTKSLIDQVSHNLIPKISVFSHQPRRLFTMAMIVNVLIGNMFSLLVFRVTFKSSWITKKPLSIIICIDEGLKMVSNTWNIYVIMAAIELEGGKPLAFYTGLTFCKMTHIVSSRMIISRYAFHDKSYYYRRSKQLLFFGAGKPYILNPHITLTPHFLLEMFLFVCVSNFVG